jgi:hypothetical protein
VRVETASMRDGELAMDQERQLQEEFSKEFGTKLAPSVVRRVVSESIEAYSEARIRSFVPILVRRHARERLLGLAPSVRPSARV